MPALRFPSVHNKEPHRCLRKPSRRIAAVTACPTGIAHVYMAARRLEDLAERLGHFIKVETQGAIGIENELNQAEIESADLVILATDIPLAKSERFKNVRTIHISVITVLKSPDDVTRLFRAG